MTFSNSNLNTKLLQGLERAGYIDCTPVQEQVLAMGLDGSDLYVQSKTGTGKTAAYLVTVMQRMLDAEQRRAALILVPTRELAVQVEEEARMLGTHTGIRAFSFYGGVGYQKQEEALNDGVDLIIGTPGRVIDLDKSGTMRLKDIGFLVVDEADRMFDMGFYPDLRSLLAVLPKAENRQTMLFSATLNTWVKNLAWEYTIDAKEITIDSESITVDEIKQQLFHVAAEQKMALLLGILGKEKPENSIVFCNTKKTAEIVAKRLCMNGYRAEFLIGDLPQPKRLQLIDNFRAGKIMCLVATDVAARGIDVNDLAMVINYDLPNDAENYVHRIGRTARAGKTGSAYSLCSEQDVYVLPEIEKYIEAKIPSVIPQDDDFQEDRSAGHYIKLDREDDTEDRYTGKHSKAPRRGEKAMRDNKHQRLASRKTGKPVQSSEGGSKVRKKASKTEEKTGKKTPNSLENLTFEERMAYYKNQYGKNLVHDSDPRTDLQSKKKKTTGKSKTRKLQNAEKADEKRQRQGTALNAAKKRQHQSNQKEQISQNTVAASKQKTGLFGILKRIFLG